MTERIVRLGYTVMFMDIFVTRRNGLSVGAPVADARSNSPGQRAAREDDWRRYFAAPHGCNHEQAELLAPSPPRLAPALMALVVARRAEQCRLATNEQTPIEPRGRGGRSHHAIGIARRGPAYTVLH
jgi:hypothetical protein